METTFRWRSWLGASVIFFLIFGVINVGLAIAVPATLHLNGSFPGVVFGAGDAQLLGRSFAGLRHDNSNSAYSENNTKVANRFAKGIKKL